MYSATTSICGLNCDQSYLGSFHPLAEESILNPGAHHNLLVAVKHQSGRVELIEKTEMYPSLAEGQSDCLAAGHG